jgi:hypothetical protein
MLDREKIKGKERFTLQIVNNTNQKQNIVLFDLLGNYNDINGYAGNINYTFDLTSGLAAAIAKGLYTVAVLVIVHGQTQYELATYNMPGNVPFSNINQIVFALNQLGLGEFTIVAGNTVTIETKVNILSTVNISELKQAIHDTSYGSDFTTGGSLIYDPGYTIDLLGTFTQISLVNSFWKNTISSFNGPYNRSSILAPNLLGVDRSFFASINMPEAKQVYIGFSFSYVNIINISAFAELYVNNIKVMDIANNAALTALKNSVNTALGTNYDKDNITFVCWYIIPVNFVAGENIVQFINKDNATTNTIKISGMEIYDNTSAEIQAATAYNQLNLLFSSVDYTSKLFF